VNVRNAEQMKSKLGTLRLIHAAHIAAIPLFAWVAQSRCACDNSGWNLSHWVVTGLALYGGIGGFVFRRTLMRRAEEALRKDASSSKGLRQWQAANIVPMTMAESIVVWGVVLQMVLGGALWQASFFYAGGLILLLLWMPRIPTTASGLKIANS
jgi:hypothetical protein